TLAVGVGVGVGVDFALACTLTVAAAEVEAFLVLREVSVAVSLTLVPAARLPIGIRACNSVWLVVSPTEQLAFPVDGHTVKVGENRLGCAASEIFAFALPTVTHTKIAYRAWVPGRTTLPLSDCTEMHSTPLGGGVDDFVGVGVGEVEGDGELDWFGDGRGDWSGDGELLATGDVLGLAFAELVGLADPLGEPGLTEALGCGEGDMLALGVDDGLALAAEDGLALLDDLVPSRTTRAVRW